MAIFTIDLGIEQTKMVNDIFKYIIILSILHVLMNRSGLKNIGFMTGKIFNENFIGFLLILCISIMSYYLVVLELIDII